MPLSVASDIFITYKYHFHFLTNGLGWSIKESIYNLFQPYRALHTATPTRGLILDVEGHPERDRYYSSNDYPSESILQLPL